MTIAASISVRESSIFLSYYDAEFDDQVILLPNHQSSQYYGRQATPYSAPPPLGMGRDAVQELDEHPEEFMDSHTPYEQSGRGGGGAPPPAEHPQDNVRSHTEGQRPAFQPGP